ncbi:uncharacterized protein LOC142333393 [Lycorma delicatula]|uniref:uncharacterized protein LOC142333393 n=1 Tax=Lycorma delicatula TaxID=130591 RepID=UPI003F512A36
MSTIVPPIYCRYICENRNRTTSLHSIESNQVAFRRIHSFMSIVNDGNVNPNELGKMVILPATFTGSPRYMHEYAQDAMTYVRACGRPDLFITFTCNPTWEEIKELLFPIQSSSDRHDITACVFKLKLKSLMDFFVKHQVFGETRCWIYSIEWQKLGLPHAHILIWLISKLTPDQIHQVISEEIPDANSDPDLFEVVTKNRIHGPCGVLNNHSPCMSDGKCTKRYPRALVAEAITGNDRYPLYRRRLTEDGGKSITLKVRNNDVEIEQVYLQIYELSTMEAIWQLLVWEKQLDLSMKSINIDCYISSNEAVWRILSFPIHERHPTVVHLAVHLENGQRVYFRTENVRTRALLPPLTTLTAFFSL